MSRKYDWCPRDWRRYRRLLSIPQFPVRLTSEEFRAKVLVGNAVRAGDPRTVREIRVSLGLPDLRADES